ncbi:MAG: AAA family ATPase [Candidatus Electrothrix sp. YB6]
MPQNLYIFFGLIASGKSTLAQLFAAEQGFPYYNTDRVRKELAGIAANERRPDDMNSGIYTPAFTEKTYQTMLDRVAQNLKQGAGGVVLDGSYSRQTDRDKVKKLADTLGVLDIRIRFILCFCSEQETKRRLELRAQDPDAVSDGRWEIFVRQKEKFESPDELAAEQLISLDTEAEPEQLLKQLHHF